MPGRAVFRNKGASMNERQPSRTALGAAGYRAAHQLLEGGKVFTDPFARTILGEAADAIIESLSADPAQQPLLGLQGQFGFTDSFLCAHLRISGAHHPFLQ